VTSGFKLEALEPRLLLSADPLSSTVAAGQTALPQSGLEVTMEAQNEAASLDEVSPTYNPAEVIQSIFENVVAVDLQGPTGADSDAGNHDSSSPQNAANDSASSPETFQFSAEAGTNKYTLRLNADDPSQLELVDDATEKVLRSEALDEVEKVSIIGTDQGDDLLTVDMTRPFTIPGGVEYDGGHGWFDTLQIKGNNFQSTNYSAQGPDSGTIQLDAQLITYFGLEPIVNQANPAAVVINGTAGDDLLVLERDSAVAGNLIIRSVNGAMESVSFAAPATSLTINLLAGNDTLTFGALPANLNIIVDGGAGNDGLINSYGIASGSITNFEAVMNGVPVPVSQGPGPLNGNLLTGITNNPSTGAVQTVAVDPNELTKIYIGTAGGGVWRSSDRTVLFEFDHFSLTAAAQTRLDQFITFMQAHPSLSVTLSGHTDDVGTDATNVTLGNNRTTTVRDYLIAHGIAAGRINSVNPSPGESTPIDTNATPAGQANNRRVELIVNHWEPLTDFFPSLSISAIAIDPSNSNIIYAATGDISSARTLLPGRDVSIGLLRSLDGGNTWTIVGRSTFQGSTITDVVVNSAGVILVSTNFATTPGGLFRSTDGGDNFTDISAATTGDATPFPAAAVSDIAIDPGDPTRIYAAVPSQGVFVSTDSGQHWNNTGFVLPPAARFGAPLRIELSMSATNAATGNRPVYAAVIVPIQDQLAVAAGPGSGLAANVVQVAPLQAGLAASILSRVTVFSRRKRNSIDGSIYSARWR